MEISVFKGIYHFDNYIILLKKLVIINYYIIFYDNWKRKILERNDFNLSVYSLHLDLWY